MPEGVMKVIQPLIAGAQIAGGAGLSIAGQPAAGVPLMLSGAGGMAKSFAPTGQPSRPPGGLSPSYSASVPTTPTPTFGTSMSGNLTPQTGITSGATGAGTSSSPTTFGDIAGGLNFGANNINPVTQLLANILGGLR